VENVLHRLETLINDPLAAGDGETRTTAQNLVGKLSSYLDAMLQPGKLGDLASLENYAEVLHLAERSPRGLTPQQVTSYSRAIWSAGAAQVRSFLPKSLPPYEPPQAGQAVIPRSGEVIASWGQALH